VNYVNHHLHVVLQDGPTCGIAALISIILYLDHTTLSPDRTIVDLANELLLSAVNMGITLQGELMSVCYMSQLAEHAGLTHTILPTSLPVEQLTQLLKDNVILIVYDKDANNEPTTRYAGSKAHWLLVTGYCFKKRVRRGSLMPDSPVNDIKSDKNCELHVFAQHGRTRLKQLWRWSDILQSNDVIRHAKAGPYLIPEDLHYHLSGRMVAVSLKSDDGLKV